MMRNFLSFLGANLSFLSSSWCC